MPKQVRNASRPSETPSAEVDDLVNAVLTASRVLVGVSARSLADVEETVTLTQFRTLVVLNSRGEINLNRLAEVLDVTPSTAMRMIDRLLGAELVTRQDNPVNRREVLLGLTEEGERIVKRVTVKRRAEIRRIVTAMPTVQRHDLISAVRGFAAAAGEPDPPSDAVSGLGW